MHILISWTWLPIAMIARKSPFFLVERSINGEIKDFRWYIAIKERRRDKIKWE